MLNDKEYQRFEKYIQYEPNSGCWLFSAPASTKKGYCQFHLQGKHIGVHRLSYMYFKGHIPKGYQIDHLCRVTCCVNPDHLEAVTVSENTQRGLLGSPETNKMAIIHRNKTHCPHGHEYTEENTRMIKKVSATGKEYFGRACKKCQRKSIRDHYYRNKENRLKKQKECRNRRKALLTQSSQ